MRAPAAAAAAIVAALLLAGCSVRLEGARCDSTDNCPSGQGCGYARKCGVTALKSCPDTCREGDTICEGDYLKHCVARTDGACGDFERAEKTCWEQGRQVCTEGQEPRQADCAPPIDCQSNADCPSGQSCGFGHQCSFAAALCPDTCRDGDKVCDRDDLMQCIPRADGACGDFGQPMTCWDQGRLVCTEGEGPGRATCAVPLDCASNDACPSGQSCGFSHQCSFAAASCPETCRDGDTLCEGDDLMHCIPLAGDACGELALKLACVAQEKVCTGDQGAATCACPPTTCTTPQEKCTGDQEKSVCVAGAFCNAFQVDPGFNCPTTHRCVEEVSVACKPRWGVKVIDPGPGAWVGTSTPVRVEIRRLDGAPDFPATVGVEVQGYGYKALLDAPTDMSGTTAVYSGTLSIGSSGLDEDGEVVAFAESSSDARILSAPPVAVHLDTIPPVVAVATGSCLSPFGSGKCLRDAEPAVTVADAHLDLAGVRAWLCDPGSDPGCASSPSNVLSLEAALDGSYPVPLWNFPFPFFQRDMKLLVLAKDQAGNSSQVDAGGNPQPTEIPVTITRLRWSWSPAGAGAFAVPAVDLDSGTLYVSEAATPGKLHALDPMATPAPGVRWTATLPSAAGASPNPPALGGSALWMSTAGGALYGLKLPLPTTAPTLGDFTGGDCPSTPGSGPFSPVAVHPSTTAANEHAYAGNGTGRLFRYAGTVTSGACNEPGLNLLSVVSSVVVDTDGTPVVATSGTAAALRRYPPGLVPTSPVWTATAVCDARGPPCTAVRAPLSMASGSVLVVCANGPICQVDAATGAALLLATPSGEPVTSVLPRGDLTLVVGTKAGELVLLKEDSILVDPPYREAAVLPLGTAALTGAALARQPGNGPREMVFATDAAGLLAAVEVVPGASPQLALRWSEPLAQGVALSPPTIVPGVRTSLPTLYTASTGGVLYAVVVDEELDPQSPWPKYHADLANTGKAP